MRMLARKPVAKYRLDYSSTNVTTSAWVEVVTTLAQPSSAVEIYNGSGSTIYIATGASGSESELPYYILPGGSSILLPWEFSKAVRVAIKAVDTSITTGSFVLNFFA